MQTVPQIKNPLQRCYTVTLAILVIGFGCASAIYLTAGAPTDNPFAEYEKSKRFANEVERMGGKTAILANDLNAWFIGLWQGESLAYTVAVITIIIAAGYYFIVSGLVTDSHERHDDSGKSP
jgi:predicted NBD/HSP70 family sugar kinase